MYDYSKLRGRIVEKLGTNQAFAKAIGLSEVSVSDKVSGKRYWKQREIAKAIEILEIPETEVGIYFFQKKEEQNEKI